MNVPRLDAHPMSTVTRYQGLLHPNPCRRGLDSIAKGSSITAPRASVVASGDDLDATPHNTVADVFDQVIDHFSGQNDIAPQNEIVTRATRAYLDLIDAADTPSPRALEKQL